MRCIDSMKDITLDCKYRPIKGLKHRVLVIPYKYIDRRYTTMNDDKSVITHFQLYPTKRGYLFELPNAFKLNGSQKLSGGFVHELSIKIDKANSDNIATMNALTKGTYVLVVETMSNTFEVLGYEAGLIANSLQRDYAGNVIGLTFTTPSDVKELRMIALWGEGDYLAMSKKFENKAFVGRNLILNSTHIQFNKQWCSTNITKINKDDEKLSEYHVLQPNDNWVKVYKDPQNIDYTYGKEVTFSFDIKVLEGEIASPMFYAGEFTPYMEMLPIIGSIEVGKWVRVYKTFISRSGWSIHLGFSRLSGKYQLRNLKLEIGNTPTDWCPADED